MFEVKVTIAVPDLATAITNLATAIGSIKPFPASNPAPVHAEAPNPISAPDPAAAQPPIPAPTIPSTPSAPVVPAVQTNYPTPSVPLAAPPQYTIDQIMTAGATLMDAGKVNELLNLLHSFGVQAVMDLKPEQLGAFATAMRDLGAKI